MLDHPDYGDIATWIDMHIGRMGSTMTEPIIAKRKAEAIVVVDLFGCLPMVNSLKLASLRYRFPFSSPPVSIIRQNVAVSLAVENNPPAGIGNRRVRSLSG